MSKSLACAHGTASGSMSCCCSFCSACRSVCVGLRTGKHIQALRGRESAHGARHRFDRAVVVQVRRVVAPVRGQSQEHQSSAHVSIVSLIKGACNARSYSYAVMCAASASTAHADEFWAFWGDGKAELDGYALTEPRYGQLREGTAVAIFVTEDFSDSLRVKADPGKHPPADI